MKEVMLYNEKTKETRRLLKREDGYTDIEIINKKGVGSKSIGFNQIEHMVKHYNSKGYTVEHEIEWLFYRNLLRRIYYG